MVKIAGVDLHLKRVRGLAGPKMVKAVGGALYAGGNMIEVEAAHSITEGSVSGKGHVPSSPGEPPNADTGVLDRNIETNQVAPLKVTVTSEAPYAVPLEIGTSKMAARPYMRPAAAKMRPEVTKLVRKAVNHAISGG